MNIQKGFSNLLGLLLVLAIVGGGSYFLIPIYNKDTSDRGYKENVGLATTTQKEKVKQEENPIKTSVDIKIESDPWSDFDTLYTNSFYNFSFKHPSTTRLLTDLKNEGAVPFVIKVVKDRSGTSLVLDDDEEYPVPKMLKIAEEKKLVINNLSITRTKLVPSASDSFAYITYDFVLAEQSFLFSTYIEDSTSEEKEVSVFIEELLKTFNKQ